MDLIHRIVEVTHLAISTVGALIVIWGTIMAMVSFFLVSLSEKRRMNFALEIDVIRGRLGAHLLLSLEIFIGADIINSVITPTWETVGILAAIVGIRTILSYFLGKEIEQTKEAQKKVAR